MTHTHSFDNLENLLHSHSTNKIIPGLERISRLLQRLGNPQDSFKAIHIVGTNGKGSTGAFISSVLKASGYNTAFYSSPHLVSPGERLLVNGQALSPSDWVHAVQEAANVIHEGEELPSYFELLTAGAFLLMREKNIDVGVVEAGLGGKLDATNTMHNVICSVIASISIDHTEYLGPTIESIAGEKFAVVRKNTPACFSGSPESLIPMFRKVCSENGALPFVVSEEAAVRNAHVSLTGNTLDFVANGFTLEGVHTGLIGSYQVKNAVLAMSAISLIRNVLPKITEDSVRQGLLSAAWPGRLELAAKNPVVILDGGHNFDGVANLCRSIRELWPSEAGVNVKGKSIGVVYAAMRDKDYSGCLGLLSEELCPKLYVTTVPEMARAAKPDELLAAANGLRWKNSPEGFALPEDAVKRACDDGNDIVIVCGSLYLVGYIRAKNTSGNLCPDS
ncbi:MAG: bifunctional folylpolyglutamate synthase/dihydrofolate synthase [Synergistaceae bacterium]|nr:bifunctional folylpolyglutamate synthase/dihydrofolate synthase [Synergistaceae bacterium]